jgi:hypothetical protein
MTPSLVLGNIVALAFASNERATLTPSPWLTGSSAALRQPNRLSLTRERGATAHAGYEDISRRSAVGYPNTLFDGEDGEMLHECANW